MSETPSDGRIHGDEDADGEARGPASATRPGECEHGIVGRGGSASGHDAGGGSRLTLALFPTTASAVAA